MIDRETGECAEGEVREIYLLALMQEGESQRQAGVDVEAATRARDEDPFGISEPGEEWVGVEGRHDDHCPETRPRALPSSRRDDGATE
ncbi:hypothetical protein GCM10010317_100050 [Streptomyces mirabilis]|nr:hypothetical protein GCM10010317_100050 [Streptomyces mirabilis]